MSPIAVIVRGMGPLLEKREITLVLMRPTKVRSSDHSVLLVRHGMMRDIK